MLASEHTFPKTRRGSLHTKNVAGRLPPSWLKRRHGSQETPCVHTPRGWKLASRTNSEENRGGLKSSGAQTTTQFLCPWQFKFLLCVSLKPPEIREIRAAKNRAGAGIHTRALCTPSEPNGRTDYLRCSSGLAAIRSGSQWTLS